MVGATLLYHHNTRRSNDELLIGEDNRGILFNQGSGQAESEVQGWEFRSLQRAIMTYLLLRGTSFNKRLLNLTRIKNIFIIYPQSGDCFNLKLKIYRPLIG